jgi:hypothetical protein
MNFVLLEAGQKEAVFSSLSIRNTASTYISVPEYYMVLVPKQYNCLKALKYLCDSHENIFPYLSLLDDITDPRVYIEPWNHYLLPSFRREHWSVPALWQITFLLAVFARECSDIPLCSCLVL